MVTVIDGDGLLLGRMASMVARRAMSGEEIAIVNAERAVISGSRPRVLANYGRRGAGDPVREARSFREGRTISLHAELLRARTRCPMPYRSLPGISASLMAAPF